MAFVERRLPWRLVCLAGVPVQAGWVAPGQGSEWQACPGHRWQHPGRGPFAMVSARGPGQPCCSRSQPHAVSSVAGQGEGGRQKQGRGQGRDALSRAASFSENATSRAGQEEEGSCWCRLDLGQSGRERCPSQSWRGRRWLGSRNAPCSACFPFVCAVYRSFQAGRVGLELELKLELDVGAVNRQTEPIKPEVQGEVGGGPL